MSLISIINACAYIQYNTFKPTLMTYTIYRHSPHRFYNNSIYTTYHILADFNDVYHISPIYTQ